jgi:uncharacterized protein YidB (DUF937 family)
MGLLDSMLSQVAGQALGNNPNLGGGAPVIGALGSLLSNDGGHGGLGGLISKFEQAGLGHIASSWVGHEQNQPVTEDQMHQALGADTVSKLAAQAGIDVKSLLPLLVTMLPAVVNALTPNGQVSAQGAGTQTDLLASLTSLLQQHRG